MSSSVHYKGHRKRLKDRFSSDPQSLADYEILELLLGYVLPRRDTKPLAKDLIGRCGSLKGVLTARPHVLRDIKGFGPGLELFWKIWREFWARIGEDSLPEKEVLNSPSEVAEAFRARIGYEEKESFWIITTDSKNRLLALNLVAQGTVDQALVHPREVLTKALEQKASGIILVHNHPGGDPRPSSQDIEITSRLQQIASGLNIRVLDHIILAEESFFSFQSQGII